MRSALWQPETWNPGALSSHAQIVKSVQDTMASLEELYGQRHRFHRDRAP